MNPVTPRGAKAEEDVTKTLTLDEALEWAQDLRKEGNAEGALEILQQILQAEPHHAVALNHSGAIYCQLGDFDNGLAALRGSVESAPEYHDAHANLGLALMLRNDYAGAETQLARAIELDPKQIPPRVNLAVLRRNQGRMDDALKMLQALQDEVPHHPLVSHAMGNLLRLLGKTDEALTNDRLAGDFSNLTSMRSRAVIGMAHLGYLDLARAEAAKLVAIEPDNLSFQHIYVSLGGEPAPERAPDGYVREVFDDFADSFDTKLAELRYCAPELLADLLKRILGPSPGVIDLLDAGCGTGLFGKQIHTIVRRLDGVDLSGGMLRKAGTLGIYDELIEAELTAHLQSLSGQYQVIASADTLCYFGDIDPVALAAHGALTPGGWLIFSVEDGLDQEDGHRLQFNGRYAHREDYVRAVLARAGFEEPVIEKVTLRMEMAKPVPGLVCAARRPA
ncbi:putative TPR repeat methyltransferase [Panacagrimonas perspica]|uniref:Putative TPR repeat methyltransferase n=1 Tax=Panacagrimonas perspica TaxID=381431 RepID=A0A4S3JZU2_9GAMM|nr:tetratricopeptide repeat protein [Panacagrimonas perspica]TDU31176.1 putative TPR repeat methyltransferase [Panacagrimonas perspica]THD01048.1 hypothetical protein B1810_21745 [Panacagrimonas perspica]